MSIIDEINKGISAHVMWKQRLREAIDTGTSEWTPAMVRLDNKCDFGNWLYSSSPEIKASPHYQKVKQLHAEFHTTCAHILELALSGNIEEAKKSIALGGDYTKTSSQLTVEMMHWKRDSE